MVTCDHNDISSIVIGHNHNADALEELIAIRHIRKVCRHRGVVLDDAGSDGNYRCREEIVFYLHCELALSTLRFIAR
jgi:hypothetical protein